MMKMTKPGFRTGGPGGHKPGAEGGPAPDLRRPFTQAQILDLMKVEFARARRYRYPVACILLQVNRLSEMTDIHGRPLRDSVRQELCRLVRDKTRSSDHLGSFGDESYLVVLPHTDVEPAEAVAGRILEGFRDLSVEVEGTALHLRLSLGVTATAEQDALFFDTLVSQAEIALEWALDRGGDQVVRFDRSRFLEEDTDLGES